MSRWRLIAGLTLGMVFVGLEVQSWILPSALFFVAWKCAVEIWHLQKPSRWLTNILTLLFLGGILLRYHTVLGQDSSSGFLVLLTSLKLLEERTPRDQKVLFLLGFILISALFLYSLEMPALVGGLSSFFFLWSAQNPHLRYRKVFLQSLPLAVFLFLFFPRVQNPFGFQGLKTSQGLTGFSDELNPGSISRIQNSDEVAFRVQFTGGKKPRPEEQYWRGQVLTFSEGLRWTKALVPTVGRVFPKIETPDYEVTLEPQGQRWLFIWEPTSLIQAPRLPFVLKKGHYFETVAPTYERILYQGKFAVGPPSDIPGKGDLEIPLLPPRVRALVAEWRSKASSRDQLVAELLQYFRSGRFSYSKNPGTASATLEDFLFKGKRGYCEHYAATVATLLREAQVPARVVTGYQGGEYNAYGRFWKFTQADAHAWVEYWSDRNQWERLDPTTVVAPERLELGGVLFETLPEEWVGQGKALEFLKSRQSWWWQARESVLQSLESWNYDLVLFLIDFNLEKQKELFRESRWGVLALGALLFLPFVLSSFYRRRRLNLAEWLLRELEIRARQQNLTRAKSETLRQFVARWTQARPELQVPLAKLLYCYEQEEYATSNSPPRTTRAELRILLKALGRQ